ncbi:6-aminopenicillanic acid acyl-transferase [Microbacterium sp. ANT_H45B]|uniref:C45 family autoproteolytic acyltransferase/hydolase n=1 Tax=Microbacterium TaxID=33882 RepID=UPI0011EDE4A1|nr:MULTISPECIES: C45 family peptidase [Microbacterium]KAA0960005.1 6-aminopenicillanic acid acyl-transferase [Microbacterium sp. ANT_H45B]
MRRQPDVVAGGAAPVVELSGDGRARGRTHGEEVRGLIATSMERWRDRIEQLTGLSADEHVARFLGASRLIDTVRTSSPDLYDEVLGIAEASGQPLDDMFAYNFMDEEWRYSRIAAIGCSVVGIEREDLVILGQNMDLPASMDGSQVLLHIREGDEPEQFIASAAGMIGVLGVNREGVACCVNTLAQLPSAREGMPVAFLIREVLRRRTRADAGAYLRSVRHASGQNYAIADRHGIDSYECSSAGIAARPIAAPTLVHTNHPLWTSGADELAATPDELELSGTRSRYNYLSVAVPQIGDAAELETVFASRDSGVCVTPRPPRMSKTFCGAVFEIDGSETRARFALGQPGVVEWISAPWTAPVGA